MSAPGLGVLIRMLAGNTESAEAMKAAIGQRIEALTLSDDALRLTLASGRVLVLSDQGQSCCESRYMRTDDDLSSFVGAELRGAEIREAPPYQPKDGEYVDDHDVQFLVVHTDRGEIVMSNHNEHNGYYGGFSVEARLEAAS